MLTQDLTQAVKAHLEAVKGRLVLAVSGGRDSMALLHAVLQQGVAADGRGCVATFNHGLRPEAADEVAFVQAWCAAHDLRCFVGTAAHGERSEAAARTARYAFLAQVAQAWGADVIVTAHHADDQAETMLLHLLRGASLQGLVGMRVLSPHPQQPDLTLCRPLLYVPRSAIEAYVTAHKIPYVDDRSNADPRHVRNDLRLHVMPHLKRLNPQLNEALARVSQLAAEDLEVLEMVFAQRVMPLVTVTETSWHMPQAALCAQPMALQRRFVQRAYQALRGSTLRYEDVARALAVLHQKRTAQVLRLTGGGTARVVKIDGQLHALIGDLPDLWWRIRPSQHETIAIDRPYRLANVQLTLTRQLQTGTAIYVPRGAEITLRGRRRGDRFCPPGLGGHRVQLAEWMVDQKVPRDLREVIPLLVVNEHIAAVLLPQPVVAYPFTSPSTNYEALMIVLRRF